MTAIKAMPCTLQNASDGLTAVTQLMNSDPVMTLKIYPSGC